MRIHGLFLAFLVIGSLGLCGAGQAFHADGLTEGATILWFLGTEITIEVTGSLSLDMTLVLDGEAVSLSSAGTTFGWGVADSRSLVTTMWILFDSEGQTEDGRPVAARGGIRMVGNEIDYDALSLGAGSGAFILVLDIDKTAHVLTGALHAIAGGQFVPPSQPGTMQVEGGGTFVFDGDPIDRPVSFVTALPWEETAWPEEHLAHLLAVLEGVPYSETEPGEDAP